MSTGTHRIARRALASLITAAALVVPAQAGAATASVSMSVLQVTDGDGSSRLTVTSSGSSLIVADPERDVSTGAGCSQTQTTPKAASCPMSILTAINAALGGGDDELNVTVDDLPTAVFAGDGADRITTGASDDFIYGQGGFDLIDGGLGSDTLDGGAGGDSARYLSHSAAVTVDLGSDQQAVATGGNGQPGEDDSLIRFEYSHGGSGDDTISGDGGFNFLRGGGGNDTLRGGSGTDYLEGGDGSDTADYSDKAEDLDISLGQLGGAPDGETIGGDIENLTGGTGDDTLTGSTAANRLAGGPGADTLTGAGGSDFLDGGIGADTIAARDGATDSVLCGEGADSGEVDASDVLSIDCESAVQRPAAAAADPTPGVAVTDPPVAPQPTEEPPVGRGDTGDAPEAPVEIKIPAVVRLTARGALPVRIACTAESGTCRGKIELFERGGAITARTAVTTARRRRPVKKRKAVRLATRSFAVRAGQQKTVPLRLDRVGRRRVIKKKRRRTRGKIVVTMRMPDGRIATAVKGVSIAAPKQRRSARRATGRRKKGASRR